MGHFETQLLIGDRFEAGEDAADRRSNGKHDAPC